MRRLAAMPPVQTQKRQKEIACLGLVYKYSL